MEKRVVLAIVLMIAVIVLTNLLFPPVAPPPRQGPAADTVAGPVEGEGPVGARSRAGAPAEGGGERGGLPGAPGGAQRARNGGGEPAAFLQEPRQGEAGDTIRVEGPLYSMAFSARGAELVDLRLFRYRSFAPDAPEDARVRMVREGDRLLGWRITDGRDTLDLRGRLFEVEAEGDTLLELRPGGEARSLIFRYPLPGRPELVFRVTYRFHPDRYLVEVEGGFEGLGGRGYAVVTSLGTGLPSNEANPDEDYGNLGYAVRPEGGDVRTRKLDDIEAGETVAAEGAPFRWVAVKNKYFVAALIAPGEGPGFGGLLARGLEEEHAAELSVSLPVPAGQPGFRLQAYLGPQEFDRLSAVGYELRNVNPIGYDWLRFIIRPLANLITAILTWLHETFSLAYGWVLILFGVLMRVVLFPLYQKSMRAQMAQMEVQPQVQAIREKYGDDPEKMKQEMMRVYKEHNLNPLAGCLPMLLPFPVLITLFFVFQSTIEFRGVPFLWLPDLSRADPIFLIPLIMGGSMFLLQWIGQRGMERNTQMKIIGYVMPVVFTVLFLQFPSGLNLYYATSNLASLPQQWLLSRERQAAQRRTKAKAKGRGGTEGRD